MKTFVPRIRENKVVLIGGGIRSDVLKKPQIIEPQNVEPQKCFGHVEINFGLVFFCGSAVLLFCGSAVLLSPPDQPHLALYFRYEDLCPKQIFIWHKPAQEVIRGSPNLPAGVETQRPE